MQRRCHIFFILLLSFWYSSGAEAGAPAVSEANFDIGAGYRQANAGSGYGNEATSLDLQANLPVMEYVGAALKLEGLHEEFKSEYGGILGLFVRNPKLGHIGAFAGRSKRKFEGDAQFTADTFGGTAALYLGDFDLTYTQSHSEIIDSNFSVVGVGHSENAGQALDFVNPDLAHLNLAWYMTDNVRLGATKGFMDDEGSYGVRLDYVPDIAGHRLNISANYYHVDNDFGNFRVDYQTRMIAIRYFFDGTQSLKERTRTELLELPVRTDLLIP